MKTCSENLLKNGRFTVEDTLKSVIVRELDWCDPQLKPGIEIFNLSFCSHIHRIIISIVLFFFFENYNQNILISLPYIMLAQKVFIT